MKLVSRFGLPTVILGAVFISYSGLALGGTFIQDDYGQISFSRLTYLEHVEAWMPLWGIRPVSLFTMSFLIQVFEANWLLYFLTNLGFFGIAIWAYFFSSHPFKHWQTKWFALGAAAMPAMASSLLFSPVNQLSANMSLALAGTGHVILHKHGLKPSIRTFLVTLAFTSSLLAYEVSLPLLIWSVLSAYTDSHELRVPEWPRFLINCLPLALSLSVALGWQKLLAPIFLESTNSRLSSVSVLAGVTWLYTLIVSLLPQLIVAPVYVPVSFLCILVAIGILLLVTRRTASGISIREVMPKLVPATLALGSASILFIGSGHASDMNGYLNRGLSSTWIVLVIAVALATERFGALRKVVAVVAILLFSANFAWLSAKIAENTEASWLRQKIIEGVVSKASLIPRDAILLVDVPCTLPKGHFDTDVFCSAWDLNGALVTMGLNYRQVQPIWDVSFESNWRGELNAPVFLLEFDDSGELTLLSELPSEETIPNSFGRTKGGREFSTLECLEILSSTEDSMVKPQFLQCIVNPI